MKQYKALLIFFLFSVCYGHFLMAQQDNKKEEHKYNENVIIIGSYEPILSDAFKINNNPTLFDTLARIPKLDFKTTPKLYSTFFIPDQISPAKVTGEPINRLYRNYARFGIGTYLSPLAELYFNSSRSRENLYGAYFQHSSSLWSIPDYGKNTFGNTTLDVFGKHFWKQSMLGAEVFYKNDFYYYYGFKEKDAGRLLGIDNLKSSQYGQAYNNFGLKANYKSLYTTNDKLHHQVDFSLSHLSESYGANELDMKMDVNLQKAFSFFQNDMQTLGLDVNFDMVHFNLKDGKFPVTDSINSVILANIGDTSTNHSILNFHPYFKFGWKDFLLNIGVNISLDIEDGTQAYIYPDLKISQAFWKNQLNLYAGLSGGLQENTLHTLRLKNPYISNMIGREYTDNSVNLYGGIVITPAKQFDFRAEVKYSHFNDYTLFGIDTLFVLQNVYKTIYDDVDLLTLGAEMNYNYNKSLLFTLGGHYYSASTDHEDKFWYNPDFDIKMGIQYSIADKIIATLDASLYGPMKAYYFENSARIETTLDARFDLNLSVQYNYSKALSIFAVLNNIANQRYYSWYNYPSQRFKAMLGLTYSF